MWRVACPTATPQPAARRGGFGASGPGRRMPCHDAGTWVRRPGGSALRLGWPESVSERLMI